MRSRNAVINRMNPDDSVVRCLKWSETAFRNIRRALSAVPTTSEFGTISVRVRVRKSANQPATLVVA